ncbi:hypothetical protein [Pontibacillus sp. HMF3514]|uniref:hypothetical protein n=1 Tax=Pontibacillus sp. HMF3514 TaxID=2692425 RepID=UPI0013203EE1|nr:hypothetical protein [Pontibacillus sp. HMF3514]QHE52855.1 hypothetical protein GS400_12845 [Pontibacillus sp. HMF3514]
MTPINKKLIRNGIIILFSIVIGVYLLITFVIQANFQGIKHEVLNDHPEITSVESINRRGEWGAFIIEYVLVVEKETGNTYRVWVNKDGDITDEVALDE